MNRLAIHLPAVLSVLIPTLSSVAVMGCNADAEMFAAFQDLARQRETTTARVFEKVRASSAALSAFLRAMPKGADLHTHLGGAALTDNLIRWGRQDGLCVRTADQTAVQPPCGDDSVPLAQATAGSDLYHRLVSAWSLDNPRAALRQRHAHFFDAFAKFSAVANNHTIDMAEEVVRRAAAQGVVHVEIIVGFQGSSIGRLADQLMDPEAAWNDTYLREAREALIHAPEFRPAIARSVEEINKIGSELRSRFRCDSARPDPACDVTVRYLIHGVRTQSREFVFGQWVYAFELAQADNRVVGVNLVAPEEHTLSLTHYDDEMTAVGFLSRLNRSLPDRQPVHVSLHAGELVADVLPLTDQGQAHLRSHIRHAVTLAGAERIGHAVDLMNEQDVGQLGEDSAAAPPAPAAGLLSTPEGSTDLTPGSLLRHMAHLGVAVEVCLTSNQLLLGAEGDSHPLATYLAAGVPVTLATDDEGILRTDLTAEYVRAATVQHLDYRQLKTIARMGVEKSFLPGASLWENARTFAPVAACSSSDPGGATPLSPTCSAFLAGSPRALQQWKLEGKFATFEASQASAQP